MLVSWNEYQRLLLYAVFYDKFQEEMRRSTDIVYPGSAWFNNLEINPTTEPSPCKPNKKKALG